MGRLAWGAALCWSLLVSFAHADARTDFLIRMLDTSAQFRVRAQAALALGGQAPSPTILTALSRGLSDQHPAVRAASAASLERHHDPSVLPALRAAENDRDSSVRSAVRHAIAAITPSTAPITAPVERVQPTGRSIYYVGVGTPAATQSGLSTSTMQDLRAHVVRTVASVEGVMLAPENEKAQAAERVIGTQKLAGFYLDTSVTSVERRPDGSVRAQVSVIIGTYPGRDLRAMLSGAATVSGGGSAESVTLQAVQAAFTGALRKLPQALEAGLARAQR
jgi:hypothetical protein